MRRPNGFETINPGLAALGRELAARIDAHQIYTRAADYPPQRGLTKTVPVTVPRLVWACALNASAKTTAIPGRLTLCSNRFFARTITEDTISPSG